MTAGHSYSDSVVIAASPQALYDLVTDVARTGEWSPICRECWWEDGAGPRVGAWFGGRNETAERTWQTRSLVVAADPGREFAWVVNGKVARWSYTFTPAENGTTLTESWDFGPEGLAVFDERFGERAPAEIEIRIQAAHHGIPATLAAIKRIAEAAD